MNRDIWIAAGVRTPFTRVDGGLANRDAIALGVPVLGAMTERATGRIDSAVWGTVIPSLRYSNIARDKEVVAKGHRPGAVPRHGVRSRQDQRAV
jgi:acetyl-CoA C-acetyltransferase